jgi:tetratricopeptide (TPR) repeat protein
MKESLNTPTPPRKRALARARTPDDPPKKPADSSTVELRLAIGPSGVGIELGKEARLGPLRITSLGVSLPTAKFPLDVSGGVSKFRHRRGELRELAIEVDVERTRKWAASKLRGVVSTGTTLVWLAVAKYGGSCSIADEDGTAVLAFDVALESRADALVITPLRARGVSLPAPATALAIACVEALLGSAARREGACFIMQNAIDEIARLILPEAGARAPSSEGARWTSIATARDAWILHASSDGAPFEPHAITARARETALILREADDALHARDYDKARSIDLALLERAPRHPEIAARIAEIDAHVGSRAEAALGTISEAERDSDFAAPIRWLRAALLAETGDTTGAIAAYGSAADREEAPLLSARGFEMAADLSKNPSDKIAWLDRAVARAPTSKRLLVRRLDARLAARNLHDAMADAERLEAQARGARERYRVWMQVAHSYRNAGFSEQAAIFFERALRFAPDDVEALAGLGHALVNEGREARGVALLARAIDLADALLRKGTPLGSKYHSTVIDIARALAEKLDDRPAAVARVRAVPNDAKEAPLARALEGRWRAEIGDLAGASLAYARLRELAEEAPAGELDLIPLLIEAAKFEDTSRNDFLAAQRALACAMRIAPRDESVSVFYKQIASKIAGNRVDFIESVAPAAPSAVHAEIDEASLDARADELARRLQADPSNDAVADELADCLDRLRRDMELFALVSARVEDAPSSEARSKWLPRQRDVLRRLERAARDEGEEAQAIFYADALARLES